MGVSGRAGTGLSHHHPSPHSTVPAGGLRGLTPVLLRKAGRQAPSETSIHAQVTSLASGQLLLTSLDTQTQRLSFSRALCPETPNSRHAGGGQEVPDIPQQRTNSRLLTKVLTRVASSQPQVRPQKGEMSHKGPSLPTRPPPPEVYFYPVTEQTQSPYLDKASCVCLSHKLPTHLSLQPWRVLGGVRAEIKDSWAPSDTWADEAPGAGLAWNFPASET